MKCTSCGDILEVNGDRTYCSKCGIVGDFDPTSDLIDNLQSEVFRLTAENAELSKSLIAEIRKGADKLEAGAREAFEIILHPIQAEEVDRWMEDWRNRKGAKDGN